MQPRSRLLEGQRILVTGASSGIGKAIALAAAEAGARVAANNRSAGAADRIHAVRDEIESGGGECLVVRADVTDAAAVAAMFRQLDEAWGGLDVLVNNAGIDGPRAPAWECDLDEWRRVLDVDVGGAFTCAREALRRMVPAKAGVVLNITSVHEVIPWTGYSAYTTAKAGLSMMTRTLAQEAAPFGVRVLALAPGAIRTPINRDVWADPAALADLRDKIPLGRLGEPEEVAQMAVVLLSAAASYVTGTTVFVDGGMTDYPGFRKGG